MHTLLLPNEKKLILSKNYAFLEAILRECLLRSGLILKSAQVKNMSQYLKRSESVFARAWPFPRFYAKKIYVINRLIKNMILFLDFRKIYFLIKFFEEELRFLKFYGFYQTKF